MAETTQDKAVDGYVDTVEHVKQVNEAIVMNEEHGDGLKTDLGWRSWLVVLVTMFGYYSCDAI